MSLIHGSAGGLGGAGAPGGALGGAVYSHTIGQSVRFSDNHHLDRTATAGNQSTWTFSAWIKRCELGTTQYIWTPYVGGDGSNESAFRFTTDDKINIYDSGTLRGQVTTTAVFRDVGAWLHLVVVLDITESTATDRLKIYVNGTLQAITTNNAIGTTGWGWNANSIVHRLGGYARNTTSNLVGYMAEVNFVDGTALTPSTFGETKDGVWIPKEVSGVTYGTNGFHIDFADSSDIGNNANSTDGTNDFTTVTNLAASDVVPDSPTNNFATMNPLFAGNSAVLSDGNLKVATGGFTSSKYGTVSTMAIPKDKKIYVEIECTDTTGSDWTSGFATQTSLDAGPGNSNVGSSGAIMVYNRQVEVNDDQRQYTSSDGLGGTGVSKLAAGDILGMMCDGATGKVWFSRNGTYFKAISGNNTTAGNVGNPNTDADEIGTITGGTTDDVFVVVSGNTTADDIFVNFGQDSTNVASANTDANGIGTFEYAPPTDYVALCSSNMSDITIGPGQSSQADDYFNTVLWSGDGNDGRTITGVGFQPDWVWVKDRNTARAHAIQDSVRGFNDGDKVVRSNNNNSESSTDNDVFGFVGNTNSDGYTLEDGTTDGRFVNNSGETYVAWNWKAGGSASTIAADSISSGVPAIASSVSANTDAGFSIVSYTGTGSNATVGHGLSSAPEMIIVRNRDSASRDWPVGHDGLGGWTNYIQLNLTNGKTTGVSVIWNDTAPTSSVFTVGTNNQLNENTKKQIAYCFHSVEGYSKVGSYVGNSNADGTFVYTGFRPAWIMTKSTSSGTQWMIYDNKREGYNVDNDALTADDTATEKTDDDVDLLSNGFKWRRNSPNFNQSTYIYLAFAEAPFKFANAR